MRICLNKLRICYFKMRICYFKFWSCYFKLTNLKEQNWNQIYLAQLLFRILQMPGALCENLNLICTDLAF